MGSVFDKLGNEEIIRRINTLTPESQPLWGENECATNVVTLSSSN